MNQDLRKFGEQFRQRRKEMNLSLKEIENATSIRMGHLNAIEEGELGKLISPVYAQGFVKQYALFLGLNPDSVIQEHPEIFDTRKQQQEFSYGIGTLEMRSNPGSGVKAMPNVVWAGVTVGVLLLAWFFAKFLNLI